MLIDDDDFYDEDAGAEDGDEDYDDEDEGEEDLGEGEGEAEGEGKAEGETAATGGEDEEGKKKRPDPDPEAMKNLAKSLGFIPEIIPRPCPICHKNSIFADKLMPTGIRIAKFVALACIGMVNVDNALQTIRFVCLNKKCKEFYKTTGTKFGIEPTTMKLTPHHNWFYINI